MHTNTTIREDLRRIAHRLKTTPENVAQLEHAFNAWVFDPSPGDHYNLAAALMQCKVKLPRGCDSVQVERIARQVPDG